MHFALQRFYTYSLMDQTDLVVNLIRLLGLKKVHLMTHDYVLPNIGHYPHIEDPEAVAKSYLNFLLQRKLLRQIE